MSGSTKQWVGDKMYIVDDEVGEYIEELEAENTALREKIEKLNTDASKAQASKFWKI